MPISNWSTTASSNGTAGAADGINAIEGVNPGQLNDNDRAIMAEIKKWYDTLVGVSTNAERLLVPKQPSFFANKTSDQAIANGSTLVTFNEVHDTANNFNGSRFTAPVAGRYLITAGVTIYGGSAGEAGLTVRKNGTTVAAESATRASGNAYACATAVFVLDMAANDYVEVYAELGGASGSVLLRGANNCYFSAHLLG